MKSLQTKYNLSDDIINLIEQYLVYKHEFNEVIDEIDLGKHIIRYDSIYSFDDRYDVYIPKIDNYIEISNSHYLNTGSYLNDNMMSDIEICSSILK